MDNCSDNTLFLIYDDYKSSLLSSEPSKLANENSTDVHHPTILL